jgi:mRNA interferase MazF
MASEYIPQRGDIILLDEEQKETSNKTNRIPGLVISPKEYNAKTGMVIFCLISGRIENYPFEVKIPENPKISGVVLSDRIRTLDWRPRNTEYLIKLPNEVFKKVIMKFKILL